MKNTVMNSLFAWKSKLRAQRIISFLAPEIPEASRVLDFGAGSMKIANALAEKNQSLKISGVDVIDQTNGDKNFAVYDGHSIPFPDKSFDVLYAISVFHHVDNLDELFSECLRVTRGKVIIHEDVYTAWWDLLITKLLDWTLNKLLSPDMHIPFNFKTETDWLAYFKKYPEVKSVTSKIVRPELWRPTRHRLFILELEK